MHLVNNGDRDEDEDGTIIVEDLDLGPGRRVQYCYDDPGGGRSHGGVGVSAMSGRFSVNRLLACLRPNRKEHRADADAEQSVRLLHLSGVDFHHDRSAAILSASPQLLRTGHSPCLW